MSYCQAEREYYRLTALAAILLIRHMRQADVVMPAGSDAPVRPFHVYGYALHEELREFVGDMGFSPYQALEAVNRINAEWMGIQNSVGTVVVGKVADLILIRKNPLKNLRRLQNLDGIMVHGRWLSGSDLKQRLSELENKFR